MSELQIKVGEIVCGPYALVYLNKHNYYRLLRGQEWGIRKVGADALWVPPKASSDTNMLELRSGPLLTTHPTKASGLRRLMKMCSVLATEPPAETPEPEKIET